MDLQAFLILFREGLEAFLILGIILAYLKQLNQKKLQVYVLAGAGLAILASIGVAMLFQIVMTGYEFMASHNILKFGIFVLSGLLLTHMILFMSKQQREMKKKLHAKVDEAISKGNALNLIGHAFLVVLREGIETVLFFAAISGGDIGQAITSWGALSGLACAMVLGYLFFKGSTFISLKTFFRASGILLMFLAAGLLVQAIGIAQDLKWVPSVYQAADGQPAEMYNIASVMPEHPIDDAQYRRDFGEAPMINGEVGLFMKAFFGYSHNPTLEEFVFYWLYWMFCLAILFRETAQPAVQKETKLAKSSANSTRPVSA